VPPVWPRPSRISIALETALDRGAPLPPCRPPWRGAVVAVMRVKRVVHVALKVLISMEPWARANEHAAIETIPCHSSRRERSCTERSHSSRKDNPERFQRPRSPAPIALGGAAINTIPGNRRQHHQLQSTHRSLLRLVGPFQNHPTNSNPSHPDRPRLSNTAPPPETVQTPSAQPSLLGPRFYPLQSPDDQQRLIASATSTRNSASIGLVRQVFFACEETQERPPLATSILANRSPQHRMLGLQRIKHPAARHRSCHLKRNLAIHPRKRSAGAAAESRESSLGVQPLPSCQRLHLDTQHRRQIAHNRRPVLACVGRGVHLPTCRAEINAALIQRVHGHRIRSTFT